MTPAARIVRLLAWIAGAIVGAAAVRLLVAALNWIDDGTSATQVIVFEAIRMAFPVASALVLARWVSTRTFFSAVPRWPGTVGAWLVGALAGTAAFRLLVTGLRWLDQRFGPPQATADALAIAIALSSAFLFARAVASPAVREFALRRLGPRLLSATFAALVGLQLATWAFGVPAVTTHLVQQDIDSYKRAYVGRERAYWEHYPHLRSSFGVPLLPGIVLVYYESQLGGLWGAGGWHVFAWWGTDQHELAFYWRWLS